MSDYDTLALLSDIRERGSLPASDLRFSNTLLLSAATKEMRERIAPMMVISRTEHLVYNYETPIVPNQQAYRIPGRAIGGGGLRDVVYLDPSGNPIPLDPLSADAVRQIGSRNDKGTPYAYFLRNYSVHLVHIPNVNGTLKMPYYARPNSLILPTLCSPISEVFFDPTDGWLLTSAAPYAPLKVNGEVTVDIIRGSPGFETILSDVVVNADTGGGAAWVYPVDLDDGGAELDFQVGDYVCFPGQSPVPQIPVELHGLLATLTAMRALKSVGDDRWQALKDDVIELRDEAMSLLNNRVAGDTEQAGGNIGSSGLVAGIGGGWTF